MSQPQTGETLDHYEIERLVARSGMASIYRAKDLENGRPVAIKFPHPEMEADPVIFDRFKREQEIGVSLDHPKVLKVLTDTKLTGRYMVTEWVEGRLLREMIDKQKRFPPERAVRIITQILDALEYIHTHGVFHRDLKPENIMVDSNDGIKLIDFGIASMEGSRRLTFAELSQVMGTPDYISPEQVKGGRGDGRSDIYAVGVMLYEILIGTTPFKGRDAFAIMKDRLLNNPVPPREIDPSVTRELQEIIYRSIERDPKNRYAHAREFAWDLQHQDQVGVADRVELKEWHKRESPLLRKALQYLMIGAIPIVIFSVLLWVARH